MKLSPPYAILARRNFNLIDLGYIHYPCHHPYHHSCGSIGSGLVHTLATDFLAEPTNMVEFLLNWINDFIRCCIYIHMYLLIKLGKWCALVLKLTLLSCEELG